MPLSLPLVTSLAMADCTAVDETEFRSTVLDAQASIDRGDIELSGVILEQIQDRLPCLTFAPAPRMWADLLVAMAIVEFNRGGAWQAPMEAALRIRPGIDRGVGQGHPLATWTPPERTTDRGILAPDQADFYVDGLKSTYLPPPRGLWLVQKSDGRFWNTLVTQDAPLPASWVAEAVQQPPRVAAWIRLGAIFGTASNTQRSNWGSDLFLDHDWLDRPGVALGVAGDLQATFFSPFGILIQGAAPLQSEATAFDARVSGVWTAGGWTVGPTLASSSADTYETDRVERRHTSHQLVYPGLTVLVRTPSGFDLSASGGLSAAMQRLEIGGGAVIPIAGQPFRLGVVGTAQRARFAQSGLPGRVVEADAARVLLRVDWVWGEY